MKYIKGDVVYLPKEFEMGDGEGSNWAEIADLPIETELIVSEVADSGWIRFKKYSYHHHPDKFVRQLNEVTYEIY